MEYVWLIPSHAELPTAIGGPYLPSAVIVRKGQVIKSSLDRGKYYLCVDHG